MKKAVFNKGFMIIFEGRNCKLECQACVFDLETENYTCERFKQALNFPLRDKECVKQFGL